MVIEADDFAEGVVTAAMRVAGEVVQRLELAEDGDSEVGSENALQLRQGGDLVAAQVFSEGV